MAPPVDLQQRHRPPIPQQFSHPPPNETNEKSALEDGRLPLRDKRQDKIPKIALPFPSIAQLYALRKAFSEIYEKQYSRRRHGVMLAENRCLTYADMLTAIQRSAVERLVCRYFSAQLRRRVNEVEYQVLCSARKGDILFIDIEANHDVLRRSFHVVVLNPGSAPAFALGLRASFMEEAMLCGEIHLAVASLVVMAAKSYRHHRDDVRQ